jgi:predicted MFS family arabinose efflux permease
MASFSVASVVGVPIGLFLANMFEWHSTFIFIVIMGIFVMAAGFKWLPPMKEHLSRANRSLNLRMQFKEVGRVLNNRNHWRAFGLTMVLMFGGFSIIPFISPYMVFNVGVLESQLPYIYLCGGLCTFFTSPHFGRLSDRFGKREVFIWIASLSMIPILILTHLPKLPLAVALVATTLFMILFSGRFVPAMSMITSSVDNQHRASFMSLNSCFQQMSAGLASFMAGVIVQRASSGALSHYEIVGWISCAFTLWGILIARRLKYGEGIEDIKGKDFKGKAAEVL